MESIESWRGDGRVYQQANGKWWSGINPLAQILAWQHVLGGVGEVEWSECARHFNESSVPVALFVATKDSACDEASLQQIEFMFDENVEQVMAAAAQANGTDLSVSRL